MQTTNGYNFPVSLRPVFDENGVELTKIKHVARIDREPLLSFAVVSNRYRLITHDDMVTALQPLVQRLRGMAGNVSEYPLLEKAGAKLLMSYTFADMQAELPGFRTLADRQGVEQNRLAFRVYAINSYNGTSPMSVQVAALLTRSGFLMSAFHSGFELSVKHIGSSDSEFALPDPALIMRAFQDSSRRWQEMASRNLTNEDINSIVDNSFSMGLFSRRAYEKEKIRFTICETAWDVYNAVVEMIHTGSRRLQESTRLARLKRLNMVFEHVMSERNA